MIRPSIVLLLAAALLVPSNAFSRSSMEAKKRISWSEYKHDFIDKISSAKENNKPLAGHMDPAQRQSSDQFWLAYYDQEKQRLHELNEAAAAKEHPEKAPSKTFWVETVTSYDVYKSKYLDPIEKQLHHKSGLVGHMDPAKRASADAFWLQVVMEEKAKLHGKNNVQP